MPNYGDLVEDWIIYLKSKGIAKKQSNPNGSLVYARQPETSDLTEFLVKSGFNKEDVRTALQSVGKPADVEQPQEPQQEPVQQVEPEAEVPPEEDQQTAVNRAAPAIEPGKTIEFPGVKNVKFEWTGKQWKLINLKSGKASKIANREVATVLTKMATGVDPEMKELLDARKKLKLFASAEYDGNLLAEDFTTASYSEAQIKQIFQLLTQETPPDQESDDEDDEEQKILELNKIKASIRDKFTDTQRKVLWRILTNA